MSEAVPLPTRLTERAFAYWLSRDAQPAMLAELRLYLRPDDFAIRACGMVYESALAGRRVTREALEQVQKATAPLPPRLAGRDAPVDWARRIVEDSAQRRFEALADRVETVSAAHDPLAELQLVRNHLQTTLVQLALAGSVVQGKAIPLSKLVLAAFPLATRLTPLDPSHAPRPRQVPDREEGERFVMALAIQYPEIARKLFGAWAFGFSDMEDRLSRSTFHAVLTLMDRAVPVNAISLFDELVATGACPTKDHARVADVLMQLESTSLDAASALSQVDRWVRDVATIDAVYVLRRLGPEYKAEPAVVATMATSNVDRLVTAVRRVTHSSPQGALTTGARRGPSTTTGSVRAA